MIIEVTSTIYKGILLEHVKDRGWKCNLGGQEYLFPNYVAAQAAIDEIFDDIMPIIKKRQGKKLGKKSEVQKLNPNCDNCAEIAKFCEELGKHLETDRKYMEATLDVLKEQKKAFQDKDYEYAEELLDGMIAVIEK